MTVEASLPARILIVDDSKVTAMVAQSYLEAAGYRVQLAEDGPSAIRAVQERAPDLILMDVVMPGLTGFETCARLRQLPVMARVPIIMLTSQATIADKKLGFEAGADDYLTKPVDEADLQMRVAAQLRRVQRSPAEPAAAPAGRVVAVYGLRGGSGVTSLTVNLALSLRQLWGASTALLDYALPIGVCDTMLNLRPRYRLEGLVTKPLDEIDLEVIEAYLTPHPTGLHLLAGFDDPVLAEQLTDRMAAYVLEQLRRHHAYVAVDTAHDLSPATVAVLDQADVLIVPFTPDLTAVRLTRAALALFKALGYDKEVVLVLNHTFVKHALTRAQIEKALGAPVEFALPYGEGVWTQAINVGVPPVLLPSPDPAITAVFDDLAWRVSAPQQRQTKPASPTAAWLRVAPRAQARMK